MKRMGRFHGLLGIIAAMGAGLAPAYAQAPAVRVSRDEPFSRALSIPDAARFLDQGAHLVEKNCYACHSTFTHLAARGVIDPLAPEVMKSRVLLERFNELMLDPERAKLVKTQHVSRVRVLSAVELARHDAAAGKLAPITRRVLDHMWSYQKPDGGIDWLKAREAPQAIDDYWAVAMMALGAGVAPDNYAQTDKARSGVQKLRLWFKAHPPQTLHERGLILMADSYIGGVLDEGLKQEHAQALFAAQHADGGWSMVDLAPWKRKDGQPLDPQLTDGYATGFLVFALARGGVPAGDARLGRAVEWIKTHQRRGGGWFTQSPFHQDRIATNTGTSLVIQALQACGELNRPAITLEQFQAARLQADQALAPGIFLPAQTSQAIPPSH